MMAETITAIYENGVLRPLIPLSLQDGETVELQILQSVSEWEEKKQLEKAVHAMVAQGLMRLPPKYGQVDSEFLARREQIRRERMATLGPISGQPLSETIIEERGSW